MKKTLFVCLAACALVACSDNSAPAERTDKSAEKIASMKLVKDNHSFARPNEARITHLNWTAAVNFDQRTINGTASYQIEVADSATEIVFDARELTIHAVHTNEADNVPFVLGPEQPFLGQPLTVPITPQTEKVVIEYTTSSNAGALLWVEGEDPFLFTQSQAILARTWLPVQDSPGIRFTYHANVTVPQGMLALMSATNPTEKSADGNYTFDQEKPIPAYLMALAAGNIEYKEVGPRTAVYATPDLVDAAAWEFADMESMLTEAEKLYGEYAWGRYDLLILPAAFPFGGMENPRLTFATPTIIAGDRSLTALVAHELAHSWSGNLVTNATWDDFWLNEGFTVYFEQRIMEAVYGRETSEMLALLSYQGLRDEVAEIIDRNPNDTHLKLHLEGRDPDDGMSAIAYDKGYFFLRLIEETTGRERFDAFLKNYFTSHAFSVMDTERFLDYLKAELVTPEEAAAINIDAWVYGPGIPDNMPVLRSEPIERVDNLLTQWVDGSVQTAALPWNEWAYQERYRFLTNLPDDIGAARLAELDEAFNITETGNNEVLFAWLEQAIKNRYTMAYDELEDFLVSVGRRKFNYPLYRALVTTGQDKLAESIYAKARDGYHSVAVNSIDDLLKDS
ncbi:MAG: M1 family metallopeptidase [Flavobacteriales bacterium]